MERSSITGYILIFFLFIGFYFLNKDTTDELEKQDAIEEKQEIADKTETHSSIIQGDSSVVESTIESVDDSSGSVTESFISLENEVLAIDFTNKGGVPVKVNLKDYHRYDSSDLILFEDNQMTMNYSLPMASGTVVNTQDLNFVAQKVGDSSVILTASLTNNAKIIQTYTLSPNSYLVDYKVQFEGLKDIIAPNNRYAELEWAARVQGQEKTIKAEREATTIYYKYKSEGDVDYLSETSDDDDKLESNVQWISFKQRFFNQTLISNTQFTEDGITIETVTPEDEEYVKDLTAKIYIPLERNSVLEDLDLYYGPNHYQTLENEGIDLQKMIPLGWGIFGWVNKGIVIPIFNWLDNYFVNYGLIILLLTLIIKMALFFPMFKVYKSTAKMKLLKPELDEIKARTGDDAQKAQQEQMKLYKQAGVSPLGGCLPQLVQMPILFAMFRFFPASIELRQEKLWWAEDLSSYDSIYDFPNGFDIPFYGDHISLFTLMMTAVTILYTYMNSQSSGQMVGPMKTVMYIMPIMFLGFFNNYAAALSFYYFLSTCITIIQNFVIRKFVIDEDKLRLQIAASKKKKVKVKKSGFQKRLEDMAKKRGIDPKTMKAKKPTPKGKKKK
ncbi:MAG: membrane protein insertase YidC [Bacteroidetes bacterium]|nr:MAG: membrane protein insertase YidC [Bacteroidota bacterium]